MAYQDRTIGVTDDALTIRGYYFPGAVKQIPLSAIHSVSRVDMATFRGKGRVWGSANPGYWANFDAGRRRKSVAFVINAGKAVKPFVTPDDPGAFESALQSHGLTVTHNGPAPVI